MNIRMLKFYLQMINYTNVIQYDMFENHNSKHVTNNIIILCYDF